MGVSTGGQLNYGVILDDGVIHPWDESPFDGDLEEWWLHEQGYRPLFNKWDDDGEYSHDWLIKEFGRVPDVKNKYSSGTQFFDFTPVEAEKYEALMYDFYEHKKSFEKDLPVELINYCSGEYPMYILAINSVSISCSRGYPTVVGFDELLLAKKKVGTLFLDFCKKYEIAYEGEPEFYLSSYWG